MTLIHLHRHSDYSLLDGCGTSFQFAELAAKLDQPALAQTDHGTLAGLLLHIKACEQNGLVPICGVEAYFRPNRLVQKQKDWQYRRWHLILLAQNLVGWHNLLKITSEAYASGFYQDPCVDWELLERYGEGLICGTSCMLGPLSYLIENGTDHHVDEFMQRMQKIFGDRLYVSIMPHDWDRQRAVNLELVSVANRYGVMVAVEGDAHYPYEDWASTQKILALISTNTTVAEAEEKNRERLARGDEIYELGHEGLFLMSENEMRERFSGFHSDLPQSVVDEAISNTSVVAGMVEPFLIDRTLKMPKVTESIVESERVVVDWCREGMRDIGIAGNPVYENQLKYELDVLRKKQVFDYFVLTGRMVRWAKSIDPLPSTPDDPFPEPKRPIRVGSGRGSAAGSLVCYLCGITTLDPIAHKLKFERFLNPERKGLPDIDIDFQSERRGEVKEYLARTLGRDAVADLVSYQTFQPRAALQLVTKTLYGYDSDAYTRLTGDKRKKVAGVTSQIDPVHDTNLVELRQKLPDLDAYAESYPDVWEHATRLENGGNPLASRMSKHAGGVIVTPGAVTDFIGTVRASEDEVSTRTAWPETPRMSICDDFGMVKIDVLGIVGMDQQEKICSLVEERTGERPDLDALPALRDPYAVESEVMQAFQRGHTLGVNQFEGPDITKFLRELKPENLTDLAAANALFRPGPIGSGGPWEYAKRKNGLVDFDVPEPLREVLDETYGVMSFQEQVMDTFTVLAGYSAGQADDVRKVIAKLYRLKGDEAQQELEEHKQRFFDDALKVLDLAEVELVWSWILPYSGYSFNRAHAGGYSIQGYQDMWLKVHFPLDFYAVLLTLESDKALRAAREGRHFGVSLLPPDINVSDAGFTPDFDEHALRYGLVGIKGVGDAAAKQVMDLRPFSDLGDFVERTSVKYSKCNAGAREAFARSGALDSFGLREDWESQEKAQAEQELFGLSLTPGGVLGDDEQIVVNNVHSEEEFEELEVGDKVVIGGSVIVKETTVKRGKQSGQKMCFLSVSLGLESWSATCFPAVYAAHYDLINSGEPVMVTGKKDDRGAVIATAIMPAREFVEDVGREAVAA